MIKNSSNATSEKTEGKGVFYQAGEIIGSIGFHIVDGKDKNKSLLKGRLSIFSGLFCMEPHDFLR